MSLSRAIKILAVVTLSLSLCRSDAQGIQILDGALDKESIPIVTARWQTFLQIALMENRQAGDGGSYLTRFIGLSQNSADAFIRHALVAIHDDRALAAQLSVKICGKAAEIVTRAELAAELDEHRRQLEAFRDQQTTMGLVEVVNDEDFEKIMAWADDLRSRTKIAKADAAFELELDQADPEEILERKCARPDF